MVDAWTTVRDRLDSELGTLAPGDALVLSEPAGPPSERPRGVLGRLRRSSRPRVRYVQFARTADGYAAECVGDGFWDVRAEQKHALIAAGWHAPRTLDAYPTDNFARLASPAERSRVASAAVEALATLGCDPATAWEWNRISA